MQQQFKWKTWGFYQGNDRLDEQDWFRLRDPAASNEIAAARASAHRAQMIGVPMAVAGIAGMATVQYGVGFESPAARVAYLGSAIVGTIGTLLYLKGMRTMRNKTLMSLDRAYNAADEASHCNGPRCVKLKRAIGTR